MVNEDNEPHGYGRAIQIDGTWFYDGQFKDGAAHGYIREIG